MKRRRPLVSLRVPFLSRLAFAAAPPQLLFPWWFFRLYSLRPPSSPRTGRQSAFQKRVFGRRRFFSQIIAVRDRPPCHTPPRRSSFDKRLRGLCPRRVRERRVGPTSGGVIFTFELAHRTPSVRQYARSRITTVTVAAFTRFTRLEK